MPKPGVRGGGDDTINGRGQIDILAYDLSQTGDPVRTRGIIVTYTGAGTGTADDGLGGLDRFSNIERITGSQTGDVFNSGNGNDEMSGGAAGADSFPRGLARSSSTLS